jgi:hypothetical protein
MVWNVAVGTSAPGLGKVIDVQQPNPSYSGDRLFSGHNGQVCLIFRGERLGDPTPFGIALWVYGEDEPRETVYSMTTLDNAYVVWSRVRNMMEGKQ